MSDVFDAYEREFSDVVAGVAKKRDALAQLVGDARSARLRDAENGIAEAEDLLRRMELEARSVPSAQKQELFAKVQDFRSSLARLRADVRKASQGVAGGDAARAELGLADDYYSTAAGQRERLLQTTAVMNQTSDRIRQGRQQLLETEDLGTAILQDLHRQRGTILSTRDALGSVDDSISRSRKILQSMGKRIIANKLIFYGIIGGLAGAILLIVYYRILN
ncbi:unnamed protein product [Pedinophyceae sp. YPF-701]|nr:unnamed protein product [Pedinophyceae sp. YPF-701]